MNSLFFPIDSLVKYRGRYYRLKDLDSSQAVISIYKNFEEICKTVPRADISPVVLSKNVLKKYFTLNKNKTHYIYDFFREGNMVAIDRNTPHNVFIKILCPTNNNYKHTWCPTGMKFRFLHQVESLYKELNQPSY